MMKKMQQQHVDKALQEDVEDKKPRRDAKCSIGVKDCDITEGSESIKSVEKFDFSDWMVQKSKK